MAPVTRVHLATGFAFALGFAVASNHLAAEAQIYGEPGLDLEDECPAGDEECSLSLRQLRGELKTAEVLTHEFEASPDAAAEETKETKEATKEKPAKAKKTGSKEADDDDDEEGDDDDEEGDDDDEDDEDDKESDKDKASDDDSPKAANPPADGDWDSFGDWDDEEEEKRGPFCCQNGQGMGATDDDDVGASCYPSSKPEPYDFCDSSDSCAGPCNGTWVIGWCALSQPEGKGDQTALCELDMNAKGTGYNYKSSVARAVMDDPCAASESDCLGCNGTWCEYIKTPYY